MFEMDRLCFLITFKVLSKMSLSSVFTIDFNPLVPRVHLKVTNT